METETESLMNKETQKEKHDWKRKKECNFDGMTKEERKN
jgi:hypothetical protein